MITNKEKEEIFRLFNEEHKTKNEIAQLMCLTHSTIIYHLNRPGVRIVERQKKSTYGTQIKKYSKKNKKDLRYRDYIKNSLEIKITRDDIGRIISVTKVPIISSSDVSEHIQNSICPKFCSSSEELLSQQHSSDAIEPDNEIYLDDDTQENKIEPYI